MDALSAFWARSSRGGEWLIKLRHGGRERRLLIGSQLGLRPSQKGLISDIQVPSVTSQKTRIDPLTLITEAWASKLALLSYISRRDAEEVQQHQETLKWRGRGIVRFHTECSRASGTNAERRARGLSPSRRLALHHRTELYTPQATIMLLKAPQSLSCPYFPPSPPPSRSVAPLLHYLILPFTFHLNPNVPSLLHFGFAR